MTTVWVNGCFDVLHRGHIELFKYSKSLGDKLIVGVDSDQKVKKDKGLPRPFNNLEDRIELLKSIKYIDEVVAFYSTKGLENLVEGIRPDVMVVGSDWEGKKIIGSEYSKAVCFFNRIEGYSTTNFLESKKT